MALAAAALAILLCMLPGSASAAVIPVTTTADSTAPDGQCSLREAVTAANTDSAFNGCPAGSGADTVSLGPGTFVLTHGGVDDTNVAGDLDLLNTVTISGAGAGSTTIDGNGSAATAANRDRVIDVQPGGIATVQFLTVTGGFSPAGGAGAAGGASGGAGGAGPGGGGIRNAGGMLTVGFARIVGNRAGDGGNGGNATGAPGPSGVAGGSATAGAGGNGGQGGGIRSSGPLTVASSTVSSNFAGKGGVGGTGTGGAGGSGAPGGFGTGGTGGQIGHGGGIYSDGSLSVTDSTFDDNRAGDGGPGGDGNGGNSGGSGEAGGTGGTGGLGGYGGGVFSDAVVQISGSTFARNGDGTGGKGGTSTAGTGASNFSHAGAGGGGGSGGGLWATAAGTSSIANSTFTGNSTGQGGDGGTAFGVTRVPGLAGSGGDGGGLVTSGVSGGALAATQLTIAPNSLGSGGNSDDPSNPHGFSGGKSAVDASLTTTLSNSILVGSCSKSVQGSGDLHFGSTGCPGTTGNPLLGPLQDNGGPTETLALAGGSPAIDAVDTCAATDQRGVARPQLSRCDIGAYEVAPPNAITGAATGITTSAATLQGQVTPNARPTTVYFDYGPTDAYGTSTAPQSAGAGVAPVPASAGVAGLAPLTTYHFRVVATNAEGTTAGADQTFSTPLVARDEAPPVFSSASLSPKSFMVDRKGKAEVAVAARAKRRGTTLRYKLSEASRVVVTIERPVRGRKVGRTCRKQTATNRKRPGCKRFTRVGRFAVAAKAGANTKKFSGRIGRKSLKPGRYRMTLIATDAANNHSSPRRLNFTVKR